jgi:hypothetical protein
VASYAEFCGCGVVCSVSPGCVGNAVVCPAWSVVIAAVGVVLVGSVIVVGVLCGGGPDGGRPGVVTIAGSIVPIVLGLGVCLAG